MNPAQFFAALKKSLPQLRKDCKIVLKVEAENFVLQNFQSTKFQSSNPQKWPRRQREPTPQRALLVKSGDMKRAATTAKINPKGIIFNIPLPYASYHNEGTDRIPQRKWIGESDMLDIRVKRRTFLQIQKHLNSL